MESIKKKTNLLGKVKWLGAGFAVIMYLAVVNTFGEVPAIILGAVAGVSFFLICEKEKRNILCEHVSETIHAALEKIGQSDCIFEIKTMRPGLIIRVYLIKANEKVHLCNKAIIDTISRSWFRQQVWITQVVNINSEEDIDDAQRSLNEELLNDVRGAREKEGKKK